MQSRGEETGGEQGRSDLQDQQVGEERSERKKREADGDTTAQLVSAQLVFPLSTSAAVHVFDSNPAGVQGMLSQRGGRRRGKANAPQQHKTHKKAHNNHDKQPGFLTVWQQQDGSSRHQPSPGGGASCGEDPGAPRYSGGQPASSLFCAHTSSFD
jgi:hypothetical protein